MKLSITENKERPMIYKEARDCVDKINSSITNIRTLVLDLYEREGWSALGYQSWRECVTKEFNHCERYLYRQLEAAQTQKNVWPIGQKQIPESQLRPLTKLKDNPERQREVWKEAVETAPDGKLTAAHVSAIVKDTLNPVIVEMQREVEIKIKEDSLNLMKLKADWNACSVADKGRFVKWQKEYYLRFMR